MKHRLIFASILLFALGCSRETPMENSQGVDSACLPKTFRAEAEVMSKVLLSEDHVSLNWQMSDRIKIFDGVSNDLDPFASLGEGPVVEFYGHVSNEDGPFYALYPYQENATMDYADGIIYADVPAIQTAVAGSVPSDAFIAAAKSNQDGTLSFRTMLGYVRFTLNDERASEIESITLSGNNGEGISGGLKISFDADGVPTDTYISGDVHRYVTLVGTFENGKDYIFAVREQPSFDRGVTISILYKDGTRRYISSEANFVDKSGNPIEFVQNTVLNISSLMAEQMKSERPKDRWVAYLHGYDIDIAGEVYNIATHGEPKLLKSKTLGVSYNAKEDIHQKSGIFFIDSYLADVELNTVTTISGDLIALIGRYEDQPNVFNLNAYVKVCSGKFVMKDLDIDSENIGQGGHAFAILDGPDDVDLIHMDACKVKNIHGKLFMYQNKSTNVIRAIRCVNSDIEIDPQTNQNTNRIIDLRYYTNVYTIKEITFDNNIVYHNYRKVDNPQNEGEKGTSCRLVDVSDSVYVANQPWDTDVSICNNTLYNIPSPWAYFIYYKVGSLKMKKNINAVSDDYDTYSGYMCYFLREQEGDVVDVSDNVYYGLTKSHWHVANAKSTWKPVINDMTEYESAVNPFKTIDFDTGTFVPIDEYAAYGAQR